MAPCSPCALPQHRGALPTNPGASLQSLRALPPNQKLGPKSQKLCFKTKGFDPNPNSLAPNPREPCPKVQARHRCYQLLVVSIGTHFPKEAQTLKIGFPEGDPLLGARNWIYFSKLVSRRAIPQDRQVDLLLKIGFPEGDPLSGVQN